MRSATLIDEPVLAGGPSGTEAVARVAALRDVIRAACVDGDVTRRIPAAVTRALAATGVFRLLSPREIGGQEIDPLGFRDVVEEASYADGSVGWCVMIGGCYATFGGLLPPDGARSIYGDPETISAGAFRPLGAAHEVEGGYRVTGRWPLASGSSHATWYIAGCVVMRNGEPASTAAGHPLIREVFFPADVVEIIDTWDATGLRATASHDYAVANVFVPSSHSFWFQEPPQVQRPLYRMPPIATFATYIASVPLGIARHAIEDFVTCAATKKVQFSPDFLADRATIQATVGRAHGLVTGGRAYVRDALGSVWSKVAAGHAPTVQDRGSLWLAATHVAHAAVEAIDVLYTAAGSSSVYATSALDRCLRDARTAVQHVCTQESNFELAGRQLLGRAVAPSQWVIDYRGEGG